MPEFSRYVGIDYSGAMTPSDSLSGLRVYVAEGSDLPAEVQPPPSPRKYWTRREIAEWLVERLEEPARTLVGIDHGFSFPVAYFDRYGLRREWSTFLDDFQHHWPTDENLYVDFMLEDTFGNAAERRGDPRWRRLTETRVAGIRSVFQFGGLGSTAKSTHAGIPWLKVIRERLGTKVHFWPFDGWRVLTGRSVIAEVYPRMWTSGFAREGRNRNQQEAYSAALWLSRADWNGNLADFWSPSLTPAERIAATIEGWILGVA